jgi:hypothetical protein
MTPAPASLALSSGELAILAELLDSERNRLMIQIRHADHRTYRDALGDRLKIVETLAERCQHPVL